MASGNSRRSSGSYADSGISCNTTTTTTINQRYACYWEDMCQGRHELDDCHRRRSELRGKLGIYYSPNAVFKRFSRDQISNLSLEYNPTGSTMINLLIYKKQNDEIWLLLVSKLLKQKLHDTHAIQNRQLLLTLPSSNPRQKGELQKQTAARALESITNENEITKDLRSRLKRFLFVDANVIYPLYLSNEHADLLTTHFSPNEEVTSVHWFPLSTVLSQLPDWTDYLTRLAEGTELAQIRHDIHAGVRLNGENEDYSMWSVMATCLMCIRNFVGFETFLQ